MPDVGQCRLIELPRFHDERGSLTVIEPPLIPFEIARVYYLYATLPCIERGQHGHRQLEQLIIAVSGALDVELDDGKRKQSFRLSSPHQGLYVCPMIWRTLRKFEDGTVCVVLASQRFDEADYYRDYGDFIAAVNNS